MVVTELTTFNIIPISHFLYNFDLGARHLNSLSYRVTPVASLTQIWLQLNFNFSKETWITENITWMEHTHTHTKKKTAGDFKCIMPPCFVIPRGLSTLYRCSLTTVAQDKPYHEKPLIRDCFKGRCTLFRPYSTIAAGISSSSFVRVSTRQLAVSSLSKGISSTLNFHESIGTDGTQTRNLSHPKRAPYQLS